MSKALCLYCGSSSDVSENYKKAAQEIGRFCADNGTTLVYGGAQAGLMGLAADAALEKGGRVIGVMPEFLCQKEIGHPGLSALHMTQTMQERQAKMAELSDGFVLLPGGLGSLAEFFEAVTWKQLGLHKKPIYIYNVGGYWDALCGMITGMRQSGFLRQEPDQLYRVISGMNEVRLS